MRIHALALGFVSLALLASRPLQVDDMFKVRRVADPALSALGDAAWQVGTVDLDANRVATHLWLRRAGQEPKELDLGAGSQTRPRFSPDGRKLAYQAGGQIWVLDLATMEKRQVTHLSGDCEGQAWSPDGSMLAFTSTTVPSGNDAENAVYLKQRDASKVKAHIATTLMYRHWTEWKDPKQVSHLFVVKADGSEAARDLTPGQTYDVPIFSDVAAGDDYAWSPDSRHLAYGAHPEQTRATSTNGEIFEVSVQGGPSRLVSRNPAMDTTPRYSPDGKYLAWRAQRRPGFESDRFEVWVSNRATGQIQRTTQDFDRPVGEFFWQGSRIFFAAAESGQENLYRWDLKAAPMPVTRNLTLGDLAPDPAGRRLLASVSDTATPPEIREIDLATGRDVAISHHNDTLVKELGLNRAESFWFKGGARDGQAPMVQAWAVKPVGFDPAKRYPVAFLIHGGPQGAWNDAWSYRWNPQTWAGRGFLVIQVNPRGSTGFGQKFCDEISGDWNGVVMDDLMAGLDAALKRFPNADPARVVAAGGSYGGYATNWIAGHYADRFAALITHAGIYNTESMQIGSEELWFPRWEFKGWPWDGPKTLALWRSQSPSSGAAAFRKPHLVIHGEIDYRVPVGEAFQLFNTLQLRGVPSKLLVFPDEGHFVLKPQNSRLWNETVLDWCERWTKAK